MLPSPSFGPPDQKPAFEDKHTLIQESSWLKPCHRPLSQQTGSTIVKPSKDDRDDDHRGRKRTTGIGESPPNNKLPIPSAFKDAIESQDIEKWKEERRKKFPRVSNSVNPKDEKEELKQPQHQHRNHPKEHSTESGKRRKKPTLFEKLMHQQQQQEHDAQQ